ncbi:C-C motif chemokine 19-like [Engraulis encrasicolus]|uniref:C-C motif chemokine 19-like n=1 Tax=Engraulis encrasicolus TaxID=184585 RepID=UPI002FCFAE81
MATGVKLLCCAALLLLCLCYVVHGGEQALDCCLKVKPKKIPMSLLASYRVQDKADGCRIHAVVFTTVKDRQLCSPPDLHWVKDRMKKLDQKKWCEESNFQGEECAKWRR